MEQQSNLKKKMPLHMRVHMCICVRVCAVKERDSLEVREQWCAIKKREGGKFMWVFQV